MVFRLRLVCNTQYIVVFAYIYIQYIGFPCHPTHVPATNIQIERLSLTPNRIASSIDDAKTKKTGGLVHSKHKQTIPTGMDRLCLFNYNKRAMDDVWRLGLRIRKEKQSAILLL